MLTDALQVNAACVLTYLTSAHHIRVLCEKIHNFPLSLITPLSPQHHGHFVTDGRSGPVCRAAIVVLNPTFRHFSWVAGYTGAAFLTVLCCCTKDCQGLNELAASVHSNIYTRGSNTPRTCASELNTQPLFTSVNVSVKRNNVRYNLTAVLYLNQIRQSPLSQDYIKYQVPSYN